MLYHINPKTGASGKCSATKGGCPFGGDEKHYTSAEAARNAFEGTQEVFTPKKTVRSDLSKTLPEWHGKLPASIEAKIADKLNEDLEFLQAVESGAIETKYASPEEFLSPPIYAVRNKGTWFTKGDGEEEYFELNDGEYAIGIFSRQGGGNRECHCDDGHNHEAGCLYLSNYEMENHPQYFTDQDDSGDYTYATHYFRGGFTEKDVEKSASQQALQNRATRIKIIRDQILSGETPVWSVLADNNDALQTYRMSKQQLESRTRYDNIPAARAKVAIADKGIYAIVNGFELTEDEATNVAVAAGYSQYQLKNLANEMQNHRDKKEDLRKSKSRIAEAEQLPEGDLKEYLLGDRGTGSYMVEEKQGRKKVKVNHVYQKGTVLGKQLEDAIRYEAVYRKALDRPLDKLKEAKKEAQAKVDSFDTLTANLDQQRSKAWHAGWPGLIRDAPPIPEEF